MVLIVVDFYLRMEIMAKMLSLSQALTTLRVKAKTRSSSVFTQNSMSEYPVRLSWFPMAWIRGLLVGINTIST